MTPSLFWHHVRLRIRERMEYRGAFLLGLLAQGIGYAAELAVVWLLLHRFEAIDGWAWPEIALLYSLSVMTYAIGAAFTFSPMTELEQIVQRGTLETVLVKPADPFWVLVAQRFNIGYLSHLILAGTVLAWAVTAAPIDWSPGNALFLTAAIASGSLIQAAALTLIGTWAFTHTRSGILFGLSGMLREFSRFPIGIFGAVPQVAVTLVIPLAFATYYPAATLLSKDGQLFPGWVGWLTPVVGPVCMWVAYRVWTRGIDRYQGAGG
jgi:ABC-2 type transport system permease protein